MGEHSPRSGQQLLQRMQDATNIESPQLLAVATVILICFGVKYGRGRHIWTLTPEQIVLNIKFTIAQSATFSSSVAFIKMGICCFYLRIFDHSQGHKLAIALCLAYTTLTTVISWFVFAFTCRPFSALWTASNQTALADRPHCLNLSLLNILIGTTATISEVWLLIAIFPSVWKLRLKPREKTILLCIVSLGIPVIGASIYRTVAFVRSLNSHDSTWALLNANIASAIELHLALICASAPCLRPVIRKVQLRYGSGSRICLNTASDAPSQLISPMTEQQLEREP